MADTERVETTVWIVMDEAATLGESAQDAMGRRLGMTEDRGASGETETRRRTVGDLQQHLEGPVQALCPGDQHRGFGPERHCAPRLCPAVPIECSNPFRCQLSWAEAMRSMSANAWFSPAMTQTNE